MATPIDLITISQNQAFQNRVQYALASAAIAVMAELGNTQGHTQRVVYARAILAGNSNVANVAIGVLTNPTIVAGADVTQTLNGGFAIVDSDIQFAVNSLFSAFAGVAN